MKAAQLFVMLCCAWIAFPCNAQEPKSSPAQKAAEGCGLEVSVIPGKAAGDAVPLALVIKNNSTTDAPLLIKSDDYIQIYAVDARGKKTKVWPEPPVHDPSKSAVQEAAEREILRRYIHVITSGGSYSVTRNVPLRIFGKKAAAFVISILRANGVPGGCETFSEAFTVAAPY